MKDENLPGLSVQMFGRPRITYGGRCILSGENSMKRTEKMLLILLYCGEDGIERSKLAEALYGREEVLDIANNLRVTLHRLKKYLLGGVFRRVNILLFRVEFTAGQRLCGRRSMFSDFGN